MLTLAFVMDPLEGVCVRTDTSFAFMMAAQDRGHRVIHVLRHEGLSLEGDQVSLRGHEVRLAAIEGAAVTHKVPTVVTAADCAAIFVRTDPPFDTDYLLTTWLLSFAERQGVPVINSPSGIRSANEKLYALRFPHLCPTTCVTSRRARVREFVEGQGGEAIAKPIDGHGGFGVVRLRRADSNMNALIDLLTAEGTKTIVVQQYLAEAAAGDRRLLVLDGELRGVVARVPASEDHRGNVHVGGRAVAAQITADDQRLVAAMADALRADGLAFVGLDVIAGKLIEVNVTSPTLVQELRDLGGPDLAREMIDRVEHLARTR